MRVIFSNSLARMLLPLAVCMLSACSSYQYAKNLKMISFDGTVERGLAKGPVTGQSCQQFVMGYPISEPPTLDKAVADAMNKNSLRYMANISTSNGGFNAGVYARQCINVKGTGHL